MLARVLGAVVAHWKKAAMALLFSALVGLLVAYRSEIEDKARILVESAQLEQAVEDSREQQARLEYQLDVLDTVYGQLSADNREADENQEDAWEAMENDETDDWRGSRLPPAIGERLRDLQRGDENGGREGDGSD